MLTSNVANGAGREVSPGTIRQGLTQGLRERGTTHRTVTHYSPTGIHVKWGQGGPVPRKSRRLLSASWPW